MRNEQANGHVPPRPRMQIHQSIIKKLATKSEWHTAEEIREIISNEFDQPVATFSVKDCLYRFKPSERFPYRAEKTGKGDTAKFRFVRVKGTIPSPKQIRECAHELIPMLELLIKEAKKDRVEISTPTLCELASKIKKILESMVAKVSTNE